MLDFDKMQKKSRSLDALVACRVPLETKTRLERLCEERGVTVSAVLKALIDKLLESET